jgi:hypothetical protein
MTKKEVKEDVANHLRLHGQAFLPAGIWISATLLQMYGGYFAYGCARRIRGTAHFEDGR